MPQTNKENQMITVVCNHLELETLGFWLSVPKDLYDTGHILYQREIKDIFFKQTKVQ